MRACRRAEPVVAKRSIVEESGMCKAEASPNPVIETLLAHRSVRSFRPAPMPESGLDLILAAAQRAPTSSNMQSYSVVVVDDRDLLQRMCKLCGDQQFVADCSVLLVFCSDISRHIEICARRGYVYRGDQINTLLVAHGDAQLACQNASIAAQSMGFGTCMLGNVRNDPVGVSDLLGLPRHVYASVGLAIGYSAGDFGLKPRLPRRMMVSRNRYAIEHHDAELAAYDEAMRRTGAYIGRREKLNDVPPGTIDPVSDEAYGWSEHTARRLSGESQVQRSGFGGFLDGKGFNRR
jgi:nitroreductase